MRELGDRLDDLARALAAGDEHDDVDVRMAGDAVQEDRLAGAEGARNAGGAALGDGEEGVDDALRRHHRLVRIQPCRITAGEDAAGQRLAHRPFVGERDGALGARRRLEPGDRLVDGDRAVTDPADLEILVQVERHHDLVNDGALRHRAQRVAGVNLVADPPGGGERPFGREAEAGSLDAARQKHAVVHGQRFERVLQAVEHLAQEPRSEPDRQQFAGLFHRIAEADAGRAFVDLRIGAVAEDAQHLGLQPLPGSAGGTDVDHLVLDEPASRRVGQPQADDILLHGGDLCDGW